MNCGCKKKSHFRRDFFKELLFKFPDKFSPSPDDARLFEQSFTKAQFKVDSYIFPTSELSHRDIISWSAYWYGLWSHRRSNEWKGFLQIELDPTEDDQATQYLRQCFEEGGAP